MEIAARVGAAAVICYSLSWPGEWTQSGSWTQSPLFAMRWATHGGIISELTLDYLAEIFGYVCEQAEAHGVDVVLSMRPFHYVSCARNFRALAERVGSPRLKVQWSPGDCCLSNEKDMAAGFADLRPYLHGLHLKDVTTGAGPIGDREWGHTWCPLGQGEVGYQELFRLLQREHVGDLFLGVATHFRDETLPEEEQGTAAMTLNFSQLRGIMTALPSPDSSEGRQ